ncbi:MAG: large-conductance mechanosensitive channel protein MscL [Dehalococcoidia bacterium]|nr:large-conductance mechanosensitive channel protein MscL [Dehalococcoidia bacterium]
MKAFSEFKQFIMRGNVIDMAVGVIFGVAFGAIVTSMVNDILMPPIGRLLGGVNFSDLFINLTSTEYATLSEARAADAAVIAYGAFINTIINFIIIAFVLFLIVRSANRIMKASQQQAPVAPPPATKDCPYCLSKIPEKATRCPACTTQLGELT